MPAVPVLEKTETGDNGPSDGGLNTDAGAGFRPALQRKAEAGAQAVAIPAGPQYLSPFSPAIQKKASGDNTTQSAFVQTISNTQPAVQMQQEGWRPSAINKPVIQNKTGINATRFNSYATQASVAQLQKSAAPIPNPQTALEVAQGLDVSFKGWSSSEQLMMGILRGPFEANWFKLRGALSMNQWPSDVKDEDKPDHNNSILFMNSMVDTRWKVWKEFTNIALQKMQAEIKEKADKNKQLDDVKEQLAKQGEMKNDDGQLAKTLDPVGSMAVTSDIDLSLGGTNTEIAVGLINREFRSYFNVPYDPGTVFDINVYASDWIHGEKAERKGSTMEMTPNAEVKGMSAEARQARDEDMEEWSIVKICRNMTPDQWTSYYDQILNAMPRGPEKEKRAKILDSAKAKCDAFKLKVRLRMEAMNEELKKEESKLKPAGAPPSTFDEEYTHQAHETRASNAIYEELLIEVKALRLRLDKVQNVLPLDVPQVDSLGKQLASKIVEALTYANEVYATEGAVQHTVLDQGASKKLDKLKQKGLDEEKKPAKEQNADIVEQKNLTEVKYLLRKEMFQQSANENVGDALHSLHTYHHLPYYAVYRAGKYLSRLIEAAEKMFGPEVKRAQAIAEFAELKSIGTNAMAIKSTKVKIGDKELEGDPQVVEKDANFHGYKGDDIPPLEQKIIGFGAKITVAFDAMNNEKKAN